MCAGDIAHVMISTTLEDVSTLNDGVTNIERYYAFMSVDLSKYKQ
jgi:hypothetical protein